MGTVSDIVTQVKYQTGVDTAYDDKIIAGINWAQQQVTAVKFMFLQETTTLTLTAGTIQYNLPVSFNAPYQFVLVEETAYYDLVPGTIYDIWLNPQAAQGRPKCYSIAGVSGIYNTVYIGCPTANKGYSVRCSYFRALATLTASSTSEVSTYYKDNPLISGAVYRLWKSMERQQFADASYQEFLSDMRIMCSEKDFIGPSYDEIIARNMSEKILPQGKINEEP